MKKLTSLLTDYYNYQMVNNNFDDVMINDVMPEVKAIVEKAAMKIADGSRDAFENYVAQEIILQRLASFFVLTQVDPQEAIRPPMLERRYVRAFFDASNRLGEPDKK